MNQEMKKTLLQGLLMTAVVATAMPLSDLSLAQGLQTAADTSKTSVFGPIVLLLSYLSYVIGGVLIVAGIMKFKAHAENATNAPLAHGFSRVGGGAALVALPSLISLANQTATTTLGTGGSTFSSFTPFQ